jgi:hypothetical protein
MQFLTESFDDYLRSKETPKCFEDTELFMNSSYILSLIKEFGADEDINVIAYDDLEKGLLGFVIFDQNRDLEKKDKNAKELNLVLKISPGISEEITCHSVKEFHMYYEEARRNKWMIVANDNPIALRLGYVVWNSDGMKNYSIRLSAFKDTLAEYKGWQKDQEVPDDF